MARLSRAGMYDACLSHGQLVDEWALLAVDEVGRGGPLGDLGLRMLNLETLPVLLNGILMLKNIRQVAAIVAPFLIPASDFLTQHLVLFLEHFQLLNVIALDVGQLLVE